LLCDISRLPLVFVLVHLGDRIAKEMGEVVHSIDKGLQEQKEGENKSI